MDAQLTHSTLFISVGFGLLGMAGVTLAVAYNLWLCFLGIMAVRDRHDEGTMSLLDKVFGYPTLLTGYVLDIIANWLFMTVFLLEFPKELTVSTRCLRHATDDARCLVGLFERHPTWLDKWRWDLCKFILAQISKHDRSGGHDLTTPIQ